MSNEKHSPGIETAIPRLKREHAELLALLREAMAWLDDTSAYHGTNGGRNFDQRVADLLARIDANPTTEATP